MLVKFAYRFHRDYLLRRERVPERRLVAYQCWGYRRGHLCAGVFRFADALVLDHWRVVRNSGPALRSYVSRVNARRHADLCQETSVPRALTITRSGRETHLRSRRRPAHAYLGSLARPRAPAMAMARGARLPTPALVRIFMVQRVSHYVPEIFCSAGQLNNANWPSAAAGSSAVAGECVDGHSGPTTRDCDISGQWATPSLLCTRTRA